MPYGQKIKMYYDPRGNVIRTVNADSSEQWVVYGDASKDSNGNPQLLNTGNLTLSNNWGFRNYMPTPWESYTYDANDLSGLTHPDLSAIETHHNTPANAMVDALGRTTKAVSRLDNVVTDNRVMIKYKFDIQGNVKQIIDPLGRLIFTHNYNLAKDVLHTWHLDGGSKRTVFDVAGKPIELKDKKNATVLSAFDVINRPKFIWAKDAAMEDFKVRQAVVYGDDAEFPMAAKETNHLGKSYKNYDESGLATAINYDFKGNVLARTKQVIKDSLLLGAINAGAGTGWVVSPYRVDWTLTPWNEEADLLEGNYRSDVKFDAVNRVVETEYPINIASIRQKVTPTYNRAGALEKVEFEGTTYIQHIAYNAKGQKLLVVWGNGLMTRCHYDKKTFRLKRIRTSGYDLTGWAFDDNAGVKEDKIFTYDLVGNVLSTTEKVTDCGLTATPNQLTRKFAYDALNRLLSATGRESNTLPPSDFWIDAAAPGTPHPSNCRGYTQQFDYDKVGNILLVSHTASGNSWSRRYNYNTSSNTLDTIDDNQTVPTQLAGFGYDENGNQTICNTERHYEWDYADRLKAYYNQTSPGTQPTVYAVYIYDASGDRVKKLIRNSSGAWESVTYIGGAFEYYTNGTDEKNYTHLPGDIEIRTGNTYPGDISDAIIYQMKDHTGTVGLRINHSGTTIDREEYYPFGDASLKTFTHKRYRYCGREKDNESGLYYYGARYYMAWMCRFVSIDPLALKYAQLTPYNYADNDPIGDFDIDGQQNNSSKTTGPSSGKNGDSQSEGAECDSICNDEVIQNLPSDTVKTKTDTIGAQSIKTDSIPSAPKEGIKAATKPVTKTDSGKAKEVKPVEKKVETKAPAAEKKEKGWLEKGLDWLEGAWHSLWATEKSTKQPIKKETTKKETSKSGEQLQKGEGKNNPSESVTDNVSFDKKKAADYATKNVIKDAEFGKGKCSPYTPRAINAGFGGKEVVPAENGKNLAGSAYGPSLINAGFTMIHNSEVAGEFKSPQIGDIAVIEGPDGGKTCLTGIDGICGHIQIWNGEHWVSDFVQYSRPFYPGKAYADQNKAFKIYRWQKP